MRSSCGFSFCKDTIWGNKFLSELVERSFSIHCPMACVPTPSLMGYYASCRASRLFPEGEPQEARQKRISHPLSFFPVFLRCLHEAGGAYQQETKRKFTVSDCEAPIENSDEEDGAKAGNPAAAANAAGQPSQLSDPTDLVQVCPQVPMT